VRRAYALLFALKSKLAEYDCNMLKKDKDFAFTDEIVIV
jgi:hypothetical protein